MKIGIPFLLGFIGTGLGCSGSLTYPTPSSAQLGGGTPGVPPPASSWMGTNISADIPFVDVTNILWPFDLPSNQRDAQGYPLPGISGVSETDVGATLPSGTYKISYRGSGSVQIWGIGSLAGPWQNVNGEQRNLVTIVGTPGQFGGVLDIGIHNEPGQSVHDLHLLYPGFDYGTTQIFMPGLLAILHPFRSIRFMDWMLWDAELSEWSQAPVMPGFGLSPQGQYYQYILALVNETGKDVWLNIPPHATDNFVRQLADFFRDGLDFQRIQRVRDGQGFSAPFQLMLEYANEVWSSESTGWPVLLATANSNPQLFDGHYTGTYGPAWMAQFTDLMKVGQAEADRMVQIGNIFRQEFSAVGKREIIAPVLAGWALGACYSDVGLRFIRDHYGEPRQYITYISIAPYFYPEESETGDLDRLFASARQNIQQLDGAFPDFRSLADGYGIQMSAYEGGQSIDGINNLSVKHLAQYDRRMYSAYLDYLALWNRHFGEALFNHFNLTGVPGIPEEYFQYGFWGSIDSVLDNPNTCGQNLPELGGNENIGDLRDRYCPKYQALLEQAPH